MKLYIIAVLLFVLSCAAKPAKLGSLCSNPVDCFVDPCRVSKCDTYPDAKCISNYCGGCNAVWYLNDQEINCAAGESKRSVQVEKACQTVECFLDPCAIAKCNKQPEAICQSNYCGGCNAWFYLGEERVECD